LTTLEKHLIDTLFCARSAKAAEAAAERFSAELTQRNTELREEVERLKTNLTVRLRILYEKDFRSKLPGNEVDYIASALLAISDNLCGKRDCQKV